MKKYLSFLILIMIGFLASCESKSLDMSKIKVASDGTVSWDDAKIILRDGNVVSVSQTHSLKVGISLKDGSSFQTTEPQIDAVFTWLKECGKYDDVIKITE